MPYASAIHHFAFIVHHFSSIEIAVPEPLAVDQAAE